MSELVITAGNTTLSNIQSPIHVSNELEIPVSSKLEIPVSSKLESQYQVPYSFKFSWFKDFVNFSKLAFEANFRDKNFVITLNFGDSMLPRPFFSKGTI